MSGRARAAILGGLVVLSLAAVSRQARAHSELVSSVPAAGSTLAVAPAEVVAAFSERPDPARSSIEVVDAGGGRRSQAPAARVPGRPDALTVPVAGGGDGVYTVRWKAVAADDGHVASGSFSFAVHAAPAPVPATVPAPAAPTTAPAHPHAAATAPMPPSRMTVESASLTSQAVRARWVYYLGLIGLLAVAFVALVVFRPPPRPLLRWGLPVAWLFALGGCSGLAAMRTSATGLGLGLGGRAMPVIVAAIPIAFVLAADRLPGAWPAAKPALGLVGVCAAACMLADVRSSHVAAARSWAWVLVGVQWVHFLAVGVWIGGLVVLVACLGLVERPARAAGVRRYSTAAAIALFAVAASGTVQAAAEVRSWHALVSTEFGRLVLVKAAVIAVLAGLGALNRFRHVPRVDRDHSRLGRMAAVEAAIGVAALAVTAVLQNAAPASASEVAPPVAVVRGADAIRTVRVALRREPLVGGHDQFRLQVTDYTSGAPVDASRVVLRFSRGSKPGAATSDLALTAMGPGSFAGEGDDAAGPGRWKVTVVIERASTGTEVALSLGSRHSG